jgi:hypothetical protein
MEKEKAPSEEKAIHPINRQKAPIGGTIGGPKDHRKVLEVLAKHEKEIRDQNNRK